MGVKEDLQGKRVLLVDDNIGARDLLLDVLAPVGVEVTQASNGQQALDFFVSQEFDLVITDEVMPRLSGSKLFEMIREKGFQTPVVILTGLRAREITASSQKTPAPVVIEKPFKLKAFLTVIHEAMQTDKVA